MATGRLPDPNTAPVTAKGDLYTYSTVPAKLAVGSNGDTLLADSAATTGLRWSSQPSASNPLMNSSFQVWQRGTSFSLAASASNTYTADRFSVLTFANQATTISRQTTSDTTNLPNIQYALRFQRNSGQTGVSTMQLAQTLETVNSIPFAGKTVTVSYYARAGADYSPTGKVLGGYLATGTGTDQNIFTPFTGVSYSITGNATLTTTWQRFSFTGTVPTTATQLAVLFNFTPTGTASTNDWFEITGLQMDVGNVALPFRTYASTLAGELAACQRYYWRWNATVNDVYSFGVGDTTTRGTSAIRFPTTMRVAPTTFEYLNLALLDMVNAKITVTSAVADDLTINGATILATVASGVTQYRPYFLVGNTTDGYVGFNSEL